MELRDIPSARAVCGALRMPIIIRRCTGAPARPSVLRGRQGDACRPPSRPDIVAPLRAARPAPTREVTAAVAAARVISFYAAITIPRPTYRYFEGGPSRAEDWTEHGNATTVATHFARCSPAPSLPPSPPSLPPSPPSLPSPPTAPEAHLAHEGEALASAQETSGSSRAQPSWLVSFVIGLFALASTR